MYILANRDLEITCDERAIHILGTASKSSYALTPVHLAEEQAGMALLGSSFSKNIVEERIISIMKIKKTSLTGTLLAVTIVLSLAMVTAFSASNITASTDLSEGFASEFADQGFLPQEVVSAMPDFRIEEMNDGSILYLWSAWDDGAFVHNIEVIVLNNLITFYQYNDYSFDAAPADAPISLAEGEKLAKRFALQYIPEADELSFINKPAYFSRYDPGHVEAWVADIEIGEHVIMVDLDMGGVIFYAILNEGANVAASRSFEHLIQDMEYINGEIRFKISDGLVNPDSLKIHISGRAEYEDGFSTSLHFLEGESWEPGKIYSIPVSASYTDLLMDIYLSSVDGDIESYSIDLLSYIGVDTGDGETTARLTWAPSPLETCPKSLPFSLSVALIRSL